MAASLDALLAQARTLNPALSVPDGWLSAVAALPDPDGFAAVACDVLAAEADHRFFDPGHFEATRAQKRVLSYPASQLLGRLLAAIFRSPAASGAALPALFEPPSPSLIDAYERDGYVLWPELLPAQTMQAMRAHLDGERFAERLSEAAATGADIAGAPDRHPGVWWLQDPTALANTPVFQRLAFDPVLLQALEEMLGAPPIHIQTNAWWTLPEAALAPDKSEKAKSRNAQRFHQDQEFVTFIKVFIYMVDVDETNGPHVYVKGSLHDYLQRLDVDNRNSARFSDEEMIEAFGAERLVAITGPAGQMAIVNTRGFHKGEPAVGGARLLVQLEYASSLYFNYLPRFDASRLSAPLQALRRQSPRLFLNYADPVPSLPTPHGTRSPDLATRYYWWAKHRKLQRQLRRRLQGADPAARLHGDRSRAAYADYGDRELRAYETGQTRALVRGQLQTRSLKDVRAAYLAPIVEIIQARLAETTGAPVSVLEVGCGNGTNLMVLAKQFGDQVRLHGIDIAAERIAVGRDWWGEALDDVAMTQGDATDLAAFADESIDIVYSVCALEQITYRLHEAVSAMARVARHAIVCVEPVFEYGNPVQRLNNIVQDQCRTLLPELRGTGFDLEERGLVEILHNPANPVGVIVARKPTG